MRRCGSRDRAVTFILFGLVASAGCNLLPDGVSLESRALVTPNGAITQAADEQRTGWYPDQPGLDPSIVGSAAFGRLFKTQLTLTANEQVYAQPLVANGKVFVATEANDLYVLDGDTGAILASRALGAPFDPNATLGCGDISPTIGVTGTPVIDNSTGTAYLFSKTNLNGTIVWYFHAVDVVTLAERAGFPVPITGTADNDPTQTFAPLMQHQRPGLLLMNGVVYGGFGSHCDHRPYRGWVIGVSTGGQIVARWATEAGAGSGDGAGVWMSNSGLVSDGAGQIMLATGNGYAPGAYQTPLATPPGMFENSVARLGVQGNGALLATDFFTPYDVVSLNGGDEDFGSGGLVALPAQFGTATVPRLAILSGKKGILYAFNRDHLGGFQQGASNGDNVVSTTQLDGGTWSRPAVWPGDGGYVYVTSSGTSLQALKYGLNAQGAPAFTIVGRSTQTLGAYSGSPIVTSNGTNAGSALVWVTDRTSQLRVYNAVPDGTGALTQIFTDTYGAESKFTTPGVGAGRVYVGSGDGYVVGYGAPSVNPTTAAPLDFGAVNVGATNTLTATITANQNLSVTSLATTAGAYTLDTSALTFPVALTAAQSITVPVTFTPTTNGTVSASINVTTSIGVGTVTLSGVGQWNGPKLAVAPPTATFGGIPVGTSSTLNLQLTNVGTQTLTFADATGPAAPFSVTGVRASGTTLAAGASITIAATFAPTAIATYSDTLVVDSDGGTISVFISGTAGTAPQMVISPLSIDFGTLVAGASATASFTISNPGGTNLTITKSKPPVLGAFTALTTLAEGTVIPAGQTVTETVSFGAVGSGGYNDAWIITGNDTSGVQNVTFAGSVVAALPRTGWVASASASSGDVPANAIDGNAATRWSSGTAQVNGQWFQVDMLTPQTFSAVSMDSAANNGDYAHGYQVFVSNDGATWGTAVATGTGTTQVVSASFAPQTARYVRVVQTSNTPANWWSIAEFNALGGSSGPPAPAPQPPTSLTVASATSTTLTLAWTASTTAGVTYSVFRGTTPAFSPGPANQLVSSLAGLSYTDAGLTASTTYYYFVEAVSAGGFAATSQLAATTTAPLTPLPRTGWVATASSTGGADVPAQAIDGVATTRWSTGAAQVSGQWFQVDMLAAQTFTQIVMDSSCSAGDYAHGYQVFVSNDGANWGAAVASGAGTANVITVPFASQTARYVSVVQTSNTPANWWSMCEFNVYGGPPPPAPQPPSALTATATSSTAISLAWTASTTSGVTYSVFRSMTAGFTAAAGNQIASGLAGPTFTDSGLADSTAYFFLVQANNGGGASASSNQATATTQATPPPQPPTALVATATSSATISVSWTASATSGVTYSVFRSTTSGFTASAANQIAAGLAGLPYADSGLTAATAYFYLVQANNAGGASASSNQAAATTQAPPPPQPPTALVATAASSTTINLGWTASTTSGVTYSVFRSTTSGFTASAANQIAAGLTGLTFADAGLAASTAYYYLAQANNASGASASSNQATAMTQAPPPPQPPTALVATAASSTALNLSWTASTTSGVTYSVFRSTTSGFTAAAGNQIASGLAALTFADSGLAASTAYYYLAQANGTSGTSAPSNQATATTQAPPASQPPTALTATASSSTAINVSWTASTTSGVTYSVFRSTTSGFAAAAGNQIASGLAALTYADSGLTAATTYYYLARANNAGGASVSSNQTTATTQGTWNGPQLLPRAAWVASASATGGADVPAHAIDTDTTTRWSTGTAQVNGQWFQLDLGAAQTFDQLVMTSNTDYARGYQIFVSTDGATWGTAVATGAGTGATVSASFALQTKRYVRIVQTSSTPASWWSLYDLNLWNNNGNPPPVPYARTTWVATASTTGGADVPAHAIDGNTTTRWSTGAGQANGQWFQLDMGVAQPFDELVMDSTGSATDYAHGYQVFASNDGATWGTAIATGTPSGPIFTVAFAPQTKRYVRVVQTSTTPTVWWSMNEINVLH
jgi:hypothetical protein